MFEEENKPGTNNSPYNNYSYGNGYMGNSSQNSYGYGNGQQSYGTYQYSSNSNMNSGATNQAPMPKKRNTAGIAVAIIVAIALLTGGIGAGYYAVTNRPELFASVKDGSKQVEETQEEAQDETAKEEAAAEEASQAAEEAAEAESKIQTTTVSGEVKAVVTDVTGVVSEVMPAMVIIHNNYTASQNYFGYVQTQEAQASGSGIIVGENDTELLIATNYHVIEGADSLEVIFTDDASVQAVVKGTDQDMDLAVIAVMLDNISADTLGSIKVATLGDSDSLKLGEPAIAIGNALGYGQSVTTGVISAINREVEISEGAYQTFIQTDAAINPGNSGGALLNISGEVIGINSNKIGGETIEGMGYAIPISVARPIIDKLMNEETKVKVSDEERGYLGISGVTVTSSVSQMYGLPLGIYVAEVADGGGAQAAGMQKGDVIVGFEGDEITSMDELQNKLEYYSAGTTVKVTVKRANGAEYTESTMDLTLGKAMADSNATNGSGNSGNGNGSGNGNNGGSIDQQPAGDPNAKSGQGSGH